MLAIHVGIEPDLLHAFEKLITHNFDKELVRTGKQWDEWDEDCTTDAQPEHVYFTTITPMVELNFLVTVLGIFLQAIDDEDESFPGRRILVTDARNFDEFYVELSYPE